MAALQPAMFPELASADFYRDDELDDVAAEVMHRHGHVAGAAEVMHRHGHVAGAPRLIPVVEAIENGEIRVLFLMNGKPLSETEDPRHHDVAGKCVKVPAIWHDVTGYDVVIWVRGSIWRDLPEDLRRGLVLHELLHVELMRDKDEQAKVGTRKHDVEGFVDVIKNYGPFEGEAAAYVRAASLSLVQPLQDVADDTGTTVTIEHEGRTATLRPRNGAPA